MIASQVVLDNTQATGPDYDEINDDPRTEKPIRELRPEEKSLEKSNNYYTLIPDEEQASTSESKVLNFIMCTCILLHPPCNTCVQSVNRQPIMKCTNHQT